LPIKQDVTIREFARKIAQSDWFNPPVIHQVQRRDGRILVEASDNVMVTKVVITILDEQVKVIEKGEAKGGKAIGGSMFPILRGRQ
jgi:hypothetical protein